MNTPTRSVAPSRSGFTLVEIMIVVAIMAICLGIGIPTIFRTTKKDPLRQAVSDLIEGCSDARSQAILHGCPYDLIIKAQGGSISVAKASIPTLSTSSTSSAGGRLASAVEQGSVHPAAAKTPFSATIHEDVIIEVIFLNLRDQMEASETRVRFHPNGMSDELRIILNWQQQKRMMVTLDPMTGIADMEGL